jgi:hypothetical protein
MLQKIFLLLQLVCCGGWDLIQLGFETAVLNSVVLDPDVILLVLASAFHLYAHTLDLDEAIVFYVDFSKFADDSLLFSESDTRLNVFRLQWLSVLSQHNFLGFFGRKISVLMFKLHFVFSFNVNAARLAFLN